MKNKVLAAVNNYHMPIRGRRVIVGFSGGSDSAALLSILYELSPALGITLTAAHVNHGIRGAEADRDERFAVGFCEERNIPIEVARYDVPGIRRETGESAEECGRRLRYAFFESLDPDAAIAVAHNLDDSAETFFLNLARGTGLKGLCGIPPVRDRIVRPLIDCTKEEILDYCARNRIPYVTDSTNLSAEYRRNRIRQEILPVLRELNPAFADCFARTVSILRCDEAALSARAQELARAARREQGFSVAALPDAADPLRDRTLSLAMRELTGTQPEARHIRALAALLADGGSVNMNGGKTLVSDGETLTVRTPPAPRIEQSLVFSALPENTAFLDKEIAFEPLSREEYEKTIIKNKKIHKEVFYSFLDCDTMIYPVSVRTKRDGDAYRPAGRGMTKTLKQLFLENRIPAAERRTRAVIADAEGILLCEGFAPDERAAVTPETNHILKIEIRRNTK